MGSLTKALGAADLGTTFAKIDLLGSQSDQADRMAEMDAEKVRAMRMQNDVTAQNEERLNKPVALANLRQTIDSTMPWATTVLEKYARLNNMVESPDGTPESEYITNRNMDSVLADMQRPGSPLVPMIKQAEITHLGEKSIQLQQQLSDQKLKPEERAALQQELTKVNQQRVQASIEKSHLDKIMSNATPDSAMKYLSTGDEGVLKGKNEYPAELSSAARQQESDRKERSNTITAKNDRLKALTADEGHATTAIGSINHVLGNLDKATGTDLAAMIATMNNASGISMPIPKTGSSEEKEALRSSLKSQLAELQGRVTETRKQKQQIMDEMASLEKTSGSKPAGVDRPGVVMINGKAFALKPRIGG